MIAFCVLGDATKPSRDARVRINGAVVIAGGFESRGGSARNPELAAKPGTVLEVRDVPADHPDTQRPGVTIVATAVDRDALVAERGRLLARLAEIDALLA